MLSIAAGGASLSACSNGSDALGRKACTEVGRSLSLYRHSLSESGDRALADRRQALTDLEQAMQPAALASSKGGNWQALEATLEESNRVPEGDLVGALSAQCSGVVRAPG